MVVYVDDIIFGSNEESTSQKFASDMQQEFEMSLLGELTFFLGLACVLHYGVFSWGGEDQQERSTKILVVWRK